LLLTRRLSMTHEAEDPEIDLPADLPEKIPDSRANTIDFEPLPYEEFLAKYPDDVPAAVDDEDLVRRAMENSRG
jgi:hypothetical protein